MHGITTCAIKGDLVGSEGNTPAQRRKVIMSKHSQGRLPGGGSI